MCFKNEEPSKLGIADDRDNSYCPTFVTVSGSEKVITVRC